MTNRMKTILVSMPFLVVGLMVLILPKMQEWEDAKVLQELEASPLKSKLSMRGNGKVVSTRHTYSMGSYGVTDVGSIRLVIQNLPFSGSSKSSLTIQTVASESGWRGSSGTGNRRFETVGIPGGSKCIFGGIEFQFTNSKLKVGDKTIDASGEATLVLIGEDREVVEIKKMNVTED